MKIYTKSGDSGTTLLPAHGRIAKDHPLVHAIGELEALLSALNRCKDTISIQKSVLAITKELAGTVKKPLTEEHVGEVEARIDAISVDVRNTFVTFSKEQAILFDLARVQCRRAERALTPLLRAKKIEKISYAYINRLADYLFMRGYEIQNG